MRYEMISADCHLDLCWLPPDLFTTNATPALRDRMPHVIDQPKGPTWVTKKGRQSRARLRHGLGRARVRARAHPSRRPHGRDRPLLGRQEGHPAADRAGAAAEGPGPRRSAGGGALRHPGRHRPHERSGGGRRGHAGLQRVARRLLLDAPRALRRARVDPEHADGRGDRGGGARGQARRGARARHRQLHGPDARSGIPTGTRSGRSSARAACRCTSTPSAAGSPRTCRSSCSSAPTSRARAPT